jgi:hypothetical protein
MIRKAILAIIVGIAVALASVLFGTLLIATKVDWVIGIGNFFQSYAALIGLLAGAWWFLTGGDEPR